MIRSMKALGLALVAVFAMSAVASSAAQAEQVQFTGYETPSTHVTTKLDVEALGVQKFNTEKAELECEKIGLSGTTGGESGTNHILGGVAKTITVGPEYADCTAKIGGTKFPATVTTNGCHYRFTQPLFLKTDEYTGTVDLACPKGKAIEIDVFSSGTPTEHSANITCTITVEATHTTPEGGGEEEKMYEFLEEGKESHVIYKNKTNAAEPKRDVELNATVFGIHYEEHGVLCPDGNTVTKTNAKYIGNATVKGTNAEGKSVHTEVSGTEGGMK